jgi:hypothetical protein
MYLSREHTLLNHECIHVEERIKALTLARLSPHATLRGQNRLLKSVVKGFLGILII